MPLARRGYRIQCIELGENMAAVARRNLERYPNAEVRTGAFEESFYSKELSIWRFRRQPSTG